MNDPSFAYSVLNRMNDAVSNNPSAHRRGGPKRAPHPGAFHAVLVAVACGLALVLWLPVLSGLWRTWLRDAGLSHGPLLPWIALGLVWNRRAQLRQCTGGSPWGLALVGIACGAYLLGCWGDVDLFRTLSLGGLLVGLIWGFRGLQALRLAAPALGLLAFAVPWPTSVTERLAFSMQLAGSAYAALLCSLLGQPVHRAGVQLAALGTPGGEPVYTVMVTRACSGLTSLMVLLSLAYVLACLTPVRRSGRWLLWLTAIPMAVLANGLRLTTILYAGAHHGKATATWIHDHETPVLVFLCTLALLGIRKVLLTQPHFRLPEAAAEATALTHSPHRRSPHAVALLCVLLSVTVAGRGWAEHAERDLRSPGDFLLGLELPFRDWRSTDRPLGAFELAELEPDSSLQRQYTAPQGAEWAELTVISGRRKRTFHSPGSCLVGCGWERVAESQQKLHLGGQTIRVTRSQMALGSRQLMLTYFFTDGEYMTGQLVRFQWVELFRRLLPRPPVQALVRIVTPVVTTPEAAQQRTDEFAGAVVPGVLERLRRAGGK